MVTTLPTGERIGRARTGTTIGDNGRDPSGPFHILQLEILRYDCSHGV